MYVRMYMSMYIGMHVPKYIYVCYMIHYIGGMSYSTLKLFP